ncbi:MFS transporter [Mycobacterium angelicum]|uniref:MFS transporter n=1 Tax=Mycobacterium angelicum TaxID=470074 RepID=A0A1W9ZA33_MYCAN|nr:MFS transporter [Mycobacterium angelicum]MCV7199470.1 MFS transporter [Mycobacterium angelicum]ORA09660.1 MFS transporter [Mycobacterium angelicum]
MWSRRATTSNYARKAILVSALGFGLDGFDLLIISFALPGIIASFHLSTVKAGWLATLTLIGAAIGGTAAGVLADRFGRVRVLTWTVVFFAVFTGLGALAHGYFDFAVYRFLAGLGLGGEFGIGMALAAEAVAGPRRARATSLVAVGCQLGVLTAALIAAPIINTVGWRGLFVVGTLPAVIAMMFRLMLPEPPMFLERQRAAARESLRLLFKDRATAAMLVLTVAQNFGYYGVLVWLPHYLSESRGLGLTKGSLWTAVTVLGMIAGILVFGQLADRFGRRPALWLYQAGAAGSVLIYSQLTHPAALLAGGFVVGGFANGMVGGLGALLAELYPTAIRATAQNLLFNVGRGIGGLAPVLIAAVATSHGFQFALALLPTIYVIEAAVVALIPERRGAVLT